MLSNNKLQHSLGVARKCAELAQASNWPTQRIHAAFLMGFLHDIGYEFLTPDRPLSDHPQISVEIIDAMLADLSEIREAIATHGTCKSFTSDYSRILNTADMLTAYDGTPTTLEDRIAGISSTFGPGDAHTHNAIKMKLLIRKEQQ